MFQSANIDTTIMIYLFYRRKEISLLLLNSNILRDAYLANKIIKIMF